MLNRLIIQIEHSEEMKKLKIILKLAYLRIKEDAKW
jgi:hypothetical protein